MTTKKHCRLLFLLTALICVCVLNCPAAAVAAKAEGSSRPAETTKTATTSGPDRTKTAHDQGQEIRRQGNSIIVSRQFADEVRSKHEIVLSTVAIKSRVGKDGQLEGFQLFQVDRGSVVEKLGFKTKDILTHLNGIPVKDLEANRRNLEMADRFDVTILRNGQKKKLQIEIK